MLLPIIVFIFIACIGIFHWRSTRLNKNIPLYKVHATVKKKRIDEWKSSPHSPLIQDYYVEFDSQNQLIELKVITKLGYEKINVGEHGVLSYQKNKFYKILIDFKQGM